MNYVVKSKLIQFENNIAELFNNAKIKAPIHLYSNNEDNLIKIFKNNVGIYFNT